MNVLPAHLNRDSFRDSLKGLVALEIIFDLPFGFPINNIISLNSVHFCRTSQASNGFLIVIQSARGQKNENISSMYICIYVYIYEFNFIHILPYFSSIIFAVSRYYGSWG